MRRANLILKILLVLFMHNVAAQNSLSKKQMYEDYDFLLIKLKDNFPQLDVIKVNSGKDVVKEICQLRPKIEKIKTYNEFLLLISNIFQLCNDGHTGFVDVKYAKSYINKISDSVEIDLKLSRFERYLNGNFIKFGGESQIKYIDDKFYFSTNIQCFNLLGKITIDIQKGDKLLNINGVNVVDYQKDNYFNFVRYRLKNGSYHSVSFLFDKKKKNWIEVQKRDGRTERYDISSFKRVSYNCGGFFKPMWYKPYVAYIDSVKILYIYMPKMNSDDAELYKNMIIKESQSKQINKVIIDVRGNSGGGDGLWMSVLSLIINEKLTIPFSLAFPRTNDVRSRIVDDWKENIENYKVRKIPTLQNNEYYVFDSKIEILPDSQSVKFDGQIYVIQDENTYSSALSLCSIANKTKKIVRAGMQTGCIGGIGLDPIVFQFPNSKLFFRMPQCIEITNIENEYDFYNDNIEMPYLPREGDIILYDEIYNGNYIPLSKDDIFKMIINE
ncbi:MAG: S41 family peptidase [Bacteroidota bacterium]